RRLEAAHALEKARSPANINVGGMPAWTGRHQEGLRVCGELGNERSEKRSVFLRPHSAAATPRFVANAPVPHAKRLLVAIRRALVGKSNGSHGRVAVRHPIVEFRRRPRPNVGSDVWLSVNQVTKMHEFVHAKLIGLSGVEAG